MRSVAGSGAMIGNPHESLERMVLVSDRNQAAAERRVALSEVGEDVELPHAGRVRAKVDTHGEWAVLLQCW